MAYSRERNAHICLQDALRELKRSREYLGGRGTGHLKQEVWQCEMTLVRISGDVLAVADYIEACGDSVEPE